MSVRMSNLDNERDDRDEDSHEDRGISKIPACLSDTDFTQMSTDNTFIFALVITPGFYVHQICSIILSTLMLFFTDSVHQTPNE